MPSIVEYISVEAVENAVRPFFTKQTDCNRVRIDFHVSLAQYGRDGITGFHPVHMIVIEKRKFLKQGGFTKEQYDIVDHMLDEAPFVMVQEAP